ncbi:B3 domain-containing protein Os11g0197600-like [Cucurbita maxima]|uniref:B3 domain-containing protein Os11g0197600-like n=1 Tax=Cucurbita maxima TaxID=3661 RepID=A0A6J1IIF1_CUCMA|nr:B3 domain-containing protein Os11g0197600-like [Cucurbita maxima]
MMGTESRREMVTARRPCFYTFYSSTLSSERLKLPSKFIRYLEEIIVRSVTLIGPSGQTWLVNLIQQNDDLFFCDGWPTFARDHALDCGDFLVFRYDDELHFTVQIFDESTCEKEGAFHSQCSQDNTGHKRNREEDNSSPQTCAEAVAKKMRSIFDVHSECRENLAAVRTVEVHKKGTGQNGIGKVDDVTTQDKILALSLSFQDEKKVSQSFSSNFPYFVRIMKSFNVRGSYTLNIPYQFSMAHLPSCKLKLVLHNLKGESWTVNSVPTTRVNTSHTLCGGWMAFVRGNDVNMGDICVFELVRHCELRVHIFRVGKEISEDQIGKGTLNRLGAGLAVIPRKALKGLPKKMNGNSLKVHSKRSKRIEIHDKKCLNSWQEPFCNDARKHSSAKKVSTKVMVCSQSKKPSKRLVNRRTSVKGDLVLPARLGLRAMVARDEERAAKSFVSVFPSFVRIMKKFNTSGSYTLKIPHQFSSAHFPNSRTEIILHGPNGGRWIVNSVPDSMGRMMHTFCGGWMSFVRDNGIQMEDICIFELIGKCELLVHITGVGKNGFDLSSEVTTCSELAIVPTTSNDPSR